MQITSEDRGHMRHVTEVSFGRRDTAHELSPHLMADQNISVHRDLRKFIVNAIGWLPIHTVNRYTVNHYVTPVQMRSVSMRRQPRRTVSVVLPLNKVKRDIRIPKPV
jgi:hypothetical protein